MPGGFISRLFNSLIGTKASERSAIETLRQESRAHDVAVPRRPLATQVLTISPPPPAFDSNAYWRESCARRLQDALNALSSREGDDKATLKVVVAEKCIDDLVRLDPQNLLADEGRSAVEAYKLRHPEEFGPLPAFRAIGETRDVCPTCGVALAKRPGRKTMCKSCGEAIFVRTRPFDNERVLVNEAGVFAIEEDWHVQSKASQRQPKPMSDEWMRRIDEARNASPDADPEVERLAQQLFAELCASCLSEAPRDAKDRLLAGIADPVLRQRVDRRIWQLQVQSL